MGIRGQRKTSKERKKKNLVSSDLFILICDQLDKMIHFASLVTAFTRFFLRESTDDLQSKKKKIAKYLNNMFGASCVTKIQKARWLFPVTRRSSLFSFHILHFVIREVYLKVLVSRDAGRQST